MSITNCTFVSIFSCSSVVCLQHTYALYGFADCGANSLLTLIPCEWIKWNGLPPSGVKGNNLIVTVRVTSLSFNLTFK